MNSRKTRSFQTLAKPAKGDLATFLSELANLRVDDDASVERFLKAFGEIIPFLPTWPEDALRVVADAGFNPPQLEKWTRNSTLWALRRQLVRIWREPDLRSKQYGVFLLWRRDLVQNPAFLKDYDYPALPTPNLFEQALQVLLSNAHRAACCPNPQCPAPFFFITRRNQKYCSEACAQPAQTLFKRRWWEQHGDEWRASQKLKLKSKKGVRNVTKRRSV